MDADLFLEGDVDEDGDVHGGEIRWKKPGKSPKQTRKVGDNANARCAYDLAAACGQKRSGKRSQ